MSLDLGRILLDSGRIPADRLESARERAAATGKDLDEVVLSLELVSEDQLADILGRHFDIPGLSLGRLPKPNPRVTRLVSEEAARRHGVVPLEKAGETMILLMADPTDIVALDLVRTMSKLEVQPVVGSPTTVRLALQTFYMSATQRLLENVVPFVGKLLTEETARTYKALPVDRDGNLVTIAMAGPDMEKAKRALELGTGLQVRPIAASWPEIERAIDRIWRPKTAAAPAAPQPAAAAAPPPSATPAPTTAAPMPPVDLGTLLGGVTSPTVSPPPPPAGMSAQPAAARLAAAPLDLGLDLGSPPPAPASAPTPKPPAAPVAAAPAKPGDGSLSLDALLGGVAAGSAAAPPRSAPPPTSPKPGNGGGMSLDDLLGGVAAAPAAKAAGPAIPPASPTAVKAPAPPRPVSDAPATPPAKPSDGAIKLGELEAQAEAPSPNLGAAGGPDGPRTGLKVEATTRDEMKALASRTWGDLDLRLANLIPERVARNYRLVITGRLENKLFIAMENPNDKFALETVEFITHMRAEAAPATPEQVDAGLEVLYVEDTDEMSAILADLDGIEMDDVEMRRELEELGDLDSAAAAEAAPVVKLVNLIIENALKARASDIHFEVFEDTLRIRYRVDGILREVMRPPIDLRDPITSRVKIMGKMDIAERRLPQDGRMRLRRGPKGAKKDIDFRLSTVPTVFGEKVVMRILDRTQVRVDLTELGMEPEPLAAFREAIHKPYGMCLVVGPSGSGKSNTLYSALADVNVPQVNIITCEDPVEFSTKGLNQVQARESIGLSFATALRAFLRQDPNIIFVGEIRDFETAEIAIKAALTGHLVMSTLHTNDAPACINRMTNMGVEPFLIATSLHVVVAQRLVRRICDHCKQRDPVSVEQLVQMGFTPEDARSIEPMKGLGCAECENMGYKGRTGLFEVLRVTNEMREMILFNGPASEIKELGMRQGMRTLRQAGLQKIRDGLTTCEEVVRETIG